MLTASTFFSLGGVAIAFIAVSLIAISNERFLKGELKRFLQKFILGSYFLYTAVVIQFIYDISPSPIFSLDLLKSIFIYLASVFFFLAANDVYELSKILGFASGRLPRKLKRILTK